MATAKSQQITLFDEAGESFESLAKTNGSRYWYARDLMRMLGYDSWATFKKIINKAIGVCTSTGIAVAENFIQFPRKMDGKQVEDFKLTRLACCLTSMNGDSKNPNIAVAQMYFAALDQVLHDSLLRPDSMDRIVTQEEVSEREITLSKTAAAAGVVHYGSFQNAGYRGMYNMDLRDLKALKGIPDLKRSLLDFMGKDELAGNLFRLALTEGRIKKEETRGQANLEHVARQVGARVRNAMIEETGIRPEKLPIALDINVVKKNLKGTVKEFDKLDDLNQERKYEEEAMAQLETAPPDYFADCPGCVSGDTSHSGSAYCAAGALASGGTITHCNCEHCSTVPAGTQL